MIIGVPKEIINGENRVSITPDGVNVLVKNKHVVYVQNNAGIGSGFGNEDYIKAGAVIIDSAEEIFDKSDAIMKVKAPLASEYSLLKEKQILFTYLHLAIEKDLAEVLLRKKITAIAYETIQTDNGQLPLLVPMSEVAGKMSIQIAANLLEKHNNGSGILLGGVPGVEKGHVVIIGAGNVGFNAAKVAVGLGADVSIVDKDINKLRMIENVFGLTVKTYLANENVIANLTSKADVVIGAVLIPGGKAPTLVSENMVKNMPKGSVIVDVAIDQGGIVETMDRITTHENPTFEKYGVIHYSVANIPGAVARTSTLALANQTLLYMLNIANKGILSAIKDDASLAKGVNTYDGNMTNKPVADALNYSYTSLATIIGF